MENVKIQSDSEVVKSQDSETTEVKNTQSKTFEQVELERQNLHNALIEARNEKKEIAKKLAEIEAREKAKQEKELAEQGKYQELLTAKQTEYEAMQKQLADLQNEVSIYRETETKKLESLKQKIKESNLSPAQIEIIESAIKGKNTIEQIDLIPKLINTFTGASLNAVPNNNVNTSINTGIVAEYEEAKKSGNISKMLELKSKMQN